MVDMEEDWVAVDDTAWWQCQRGQYTNPNPNGSVPRWSMDGVLAVDQLTAVLAGQSAANGQQAGSAHAASQHGAKTTRLDVVDNQHGIVAGRRRGIMHGSRAVDRAGDRAASCTAAWQWTRQHRARMAGPTWAINMAACQWTRQHSWHGITTGSRRRSITAGHNDGKSTRSPAVRSAGQLTTCASRRQTKPASRARHRLDAQPTAPASRRGDDVRVD